MRRRSSRPAGRRARRSARGRRVPAPVRGRAIQQLGRLVEDNAEALARIITREIGKPMREARGSVQEVVDTCNFFVSEGRRLYGMTVPSELPDKQLFTFRNPVGVAAIVTAGNFPVAVPSWYLVPALLCGNAVVWKPAEYAPATSEALARAVRARGVPAGGVQHGARRRADGVRGARARARRGARRQGRVHRLDRGRPADRRARAVGTCSRPCLELGGKNPLVVMPDADLDLAVEGALFSGFGTAGQRCTSLGTVIVHASVHDEFLVAVRRGGRGGADRRPVRGRAVRPDDQRAVLRALPRVARLDPAAPPRSRLERDRADHVGRTRGTGSSAIPTTGSSCHPTIVDGVTRGRRPLQAGDVRTDRRRRDVRRLRRGDRARERPRLRAVVVDLHERPEERVPVPRAASRRAW